MSDNQLTEPEAAVIIQQYARGTHGVFRIHNTGDLVYKIVCQKQGDEQLDPAKLPEVTLLQKASAPFRSESFVIGTSTDSHRDDFEHVTLTIPTSALDLEKLKNHEIKIHGAEAESGIAATF